MEESRTGTSRVTEFLRRARPRPGGPTYRYVKGEISKSEYHIELERERRRAGRPEGPKPAST